jgi:hypothetical protein
LRLLIFFALVTASALTGCSGASNILPQQAEYPSNSLARARQIVSVDDLRMMLSMHPNNIGSILAQYTSVPASRAFYTPSLVPTTSNLYEAEDGSTFAAPSADSAAPSATSTCSMTKWTGNAPPSCDSTGPFRRAYSPGSYSGMYAYFTLPSSQSGMPKGPNPKNGDTGFVYVEAWPGVNATNSEYGLQYSAANNWYTQYLRSNGAYLLNKNTKAASFRPGGSFVINVVEQAYVAGECSSPPCFDGEVIDMGSDCDSSGYDCYDSFVENKDPAFIVNCCYWARMTTIAQTSNIFNDGSLFSNIAWSNSELGKYPGTNGPPDNYSTWTNGGAQNWPSDSTRIIVTNYSVSNETDTIDLHS